MGKENTVEVTIEISETQLYELRKIAVCSFRGPNGSRVVFNKDNLDERSISEILAIISSPPKPFSALPTTEPEFFEWTVKLKVHKIWVEDGFDLDDEKATEMLQSFITFAHGTEVEAEVLNAPDPKLIRKVQGFED